MLHPNARYVEIINNLISGIERSIVIGKSLKAVKHGAKYLLRASGALHYNYIGIETSSTLTIVYVGTGSPWQEYQIKYISKFLTWQY